jgi:transposase
MKAYSLDLRERAVQSVESGECNIPQAAQRFHLSVPSLERWLARWRATGRCAPLPHAGGPTRKLAAAEKAIRATVKREPDVSLQELCERVEQATHIHSNTSMMVRELQRLRWVRKKSRSTPASGTRRGCNASDAAFGRRSRLGT